MRLPYLGGGSTDVSLDSRKYMECTEDPGRYDDVPVDKIVAGLERVYGQDRVRGWIRIFEEHGVTGLRDFWKEDVVKD